MTGLPVLIVQLFLVLGFILVVMGIFGVQFGYEDAGKDFAKAGGLSFLVALAFVCLGLFMAYIHNKVFIKE
jgi:hypothetical protein